MANPQHQNHQPIIQELTNQAVVTHAVAPKPTKGTNQPLAALIGMFSLADQLA